MAAGPLCDLSASHPTKHPDLRIITLSPDGPVSHLPRGHLAPDAVAAQGCHGAMGMAPHKPWASSPQGTGWTTDTICVCISPVRPLWSSARSSQQSPDLHGVKTVDRRRCVRFALRSPLL